MFGRILGILIVIIVAVYLAGSFKSAEISTTIEIDAPRERVWAVLTDLPAYKDWNPFITEASGQVREGADLTLKFAPTGGQGEMIIQPSVEDVEANRRFVWFGRLYLPAIFDAMHRFDLEATPSGGTKLTQRELFSGVMLYFVNVADFESGFVAMNEALKQRAEIPPVEAPATETPAPTAAPGTPAPGTSAATPPGPSTIPQGAAPGGRLQPNAGFMIPRPGQSSSGGSAVTPPAGTAPTGSAPAETTTPTPSVIPQGAAPGGRPQPNAGFMIPRPGQSSSGGSAATPPAATPPAATPAAEPEDTESPPADDEPMPGEPGGPPALP